MKSLSKSSVSILTIMTLSACGGGGGGLGLAGLEARLTTLSTDPTIASMTPDATVNARSGTASYSGVVNIGTDDPANPAGATAYLGNLDMAVNFNNASTSDAVSGSASGFVQYFSEVASPNTGNAVPGSLDISGALTGDNETMTDGITGVATGSIDGTTVAYDVEGNINGVSSNAMFLWFDGTNAVSTGGVGIAVE